MFFLLVTLFAISTICNIRKPPYHRTYKPGELFIPLILQGEYTFSKNYWLNVDYMNENLEIRSSKTNQIVWKNPPLGSFIGFENTTSITKEFNGMFIIDEGICFSSCKNQYIQKVITEDLSNTIFVLGYISCEKVLDRTKTKNIDFSLRITDLTDFLELEFNFTSPYNSIHLSLGVSSDYGTQIHGMGVQNTFYNLQGKQVEVVVSEHGVGRGKEPVTSIVDVFQNRGGGNPTKSYSPIPFFISTCLYECSRTWSTSGYWFKDLYDLSIFDFTSWMFSDVWIYNSSPGPKTITLNVYVGDSVKSVVSTHALKGVKSTQLILPEWYHSGVIIGLQGGTERVKSLVTKLLDTFFGNATTSSSQQNIIAGIWLQDWSGQREGGNHQKRLVWNWDLNTKLYSNWSSLVDFLHSHNIRLLSYINPFLVDPSKVVSNSQEKMDDNINTFSKSSSSSVYKYDYWKLMLDSDCFVMNSSLKPVILEQSFDASILDLSNPVCVNLTKLMITRMIQLYNFDGYMLDFGEYTPVEDVRIHDMTILKSFHNMYPEIWQKINREVISDIGRLDDVVFFTRSGYSYSPRYTLSMWAGDQLTTFDEFDGLQSSMITLLTSGLSGLSNIHTDCGGYTSFQLDIGEVEIFQVSRSKELLWRWMEFSAFTLVFRSHEGMDPSDNFQIYDDDDTIHLLCQLGTVFNCLHSYRVNMMKQNIQDGVPIYRHLEMDYPNDQNSTTFGNEEYLFGEDFLVAPIMQKGVVNKDVYVPEGEWVHIWTGKTYQGNQVAHFMNVNHGETPAFFKKGSSFGDDFLKCIPQRKACSS